MKVNISVIRYRKAAGTLAALLSLMGAGGCASMFGGAKDTGEAIEIAPVSETADASSDNGGDATVRETAEEIRRQAAQAYAAGDLDTALYMFVEAAQLDPEDSHSLYAIGAIHENRGSFELAARAYQRAVQVDPGHALAQQQLGAAQLRARNLDAAQTSLTAALAANPSLWRAHDLLGVIADMQERHDEAIAHYSQAIVLQPGVASVVNNRGYSKYLWGDLNAAAEDFLLALRIDPNYERAWRNIGLVRARQQRYPEARNAMEQVAARHVAANDVGYIAMLNGDRASAKRLFEEAITLAPRFYPTAVENLAELARTNANPAPLVATDTPAGSDIEPEDLDQESEATAAIQ
ncbi:MAG TPA: tetratricopeptide repeat protein [Gammaproteobacteria bacterium]|nr:tetratricopeptide repeat protein [Gammaproteobacteria bacterium]